MSVSSDSTPSLRRETGDGVPVAAGTRKRLEHIDAMRPVKQAAVISTHALFFFAPLATSSTVVGFLILSRFSRDAFLFVSACMLTYSYKDAQRMKLGHYFARRFVAVGLPYLTWTVIYYFYTRASAVGSFPYYTFRGSGVFASSGLHYFVHILATGYYHLYYLIVIMEFYVVFPLLLVLVRKYRRLHLPLFAAAVIWQVLYGVLVSTHDLGFNLSGTTQSRMVFSYAVYLIGGVIVAMHLSEVHDWICRHSRPILLWTLASIVLAELCSYVARYAWFPVYLRTGLNVFAPTSIPFNVGAILCIYLLGVHLTSPNRTVRTRAIVQSGADNSYGVYLSQMLWIPALVRLRDHFSLHLAWPIAVLIAVVIVYMVGYVFTALMARTPLARAVTGRGRAPLGTLWPFHPRGKSDLGGDIGNGPLELTSE